MRPLLRTLIAVCALAVLVAGCGDDSKPSAPAKKPSVTPGGTVGAEGTAGLVGPSASVEQDSGQTLLGKQGPIAPTENQPTDAQRSGVAGASACASAADAPSSGNLRSIARATICLLNAERTAKGLAPLKINVRLNRASQLMANLMVKKRFFAHDTPDGRSVLDRVRPTGYVRGNWSLGENIAWGSGALATPRAIVNGWMHSKGHRDNILRGKFKDIGIGLKLGAPGRGLSGGATYVTDFGRHG